MVLSPLGVTFSREKVCVVGILFRFRLGIPPKFTLCHPDQQGILDKWWQLCLVCVCIQDERCVFVLPCVMYVAHGLDRYTNRVIDTTEIRCWCVQHHYLPPYTLLKNTHLEKDNTSETIYPFLVFAHFFFAHNTHIWVYPHTRSKVVWYPGAIFFYQSSFSTCHPYSCARNA